MISAGGCIYFSYLGVTVMSKKKTLRPEIERFKHILIKAYQRGELSANMTTKDMVQELAHQLKQVLKGNHK
ncbi:hypothetical protein B1no1_21070 [Thermolongibacillus altinsuensis]|jgi:hypothetical protein|nr:hypothetical protein B1no1_21070 [Thermolongibacillus altinsuensis]